MIKSVSLKQMKNLYEITDLDSSAEQCEYLYVHITPNSDIPFALKSAMRFHGIIVTLIRSGSITVSVDMEQFTLKGNGMMVTGSNSIITFDNDPTQDLDASVLLVSEEFVQDLNFEIVVINNLPIESNRAPYVSLSPEETAHMVAYLELLDMNARQNVGDGNEMIHRGISRSLLTSTLYQLMLTAIKSRDKLDDCDDSGNGNKPRSRRMHYTHEFVRLVRKHFRAQHTVKFYADNLCISPKYLSLVVKDCTGRSAAEIIDEYLLLEAKNLLRFSGKNIQQVAYDLNFTNQSSFGKYFKHLTGLSPSEFQSS